MIVKPQATKSFSLALGYAAVYYFLQYILFKAGVVAEFPKDITLLNWDAHWYHSIVNEGYKYSLEGYSNSGFFILFPLLWKTLGVGIWGICIVNILLFAAGFAVFNSIYDISIKDRLLWLTFPSVYIAFVPYSESLFVFLSALMLWAIVKNNKYILWLSLFLLALTRPVTAILGPAFLIMELITNDNKHWLRSIKNFVAYYALPMFIGLWLFIWYQYHETGIWFAYFKQQQMHWGHHFSLPTLPFNSGFGKRVLWLNAAALFMSFLSLIILIKYGVKWLRKNIGVNDKLFVLSCLYFTGIGFVTILFNPTWGGGSTNIYDMHRYACVSPFFWVLLHRFTIVNKYKLLDYLKVFLLINIFWLTFYHFQHIQTFLYYNLASAYILLFMLNLDSQVKWVRYLALILTGVVFQIALLQWYMVWLYPG